MGLSSRKKVLYALGQFGLVLCAYGVGTFFVSFYVTRSFSDTPVFPDFIDQKYLFGVFTVTGFVIALARLVDAAVGLLSGHVSDSSLMKRGRRTGSMVIASAPLALFSLLVFIPPVNGPSPLNAAFLLVSTVLFYIFLSLYTTPYLALLSECGSTPGDRLKISTYMACATAIASLLGDRMTLFADKVGLALGTSPLASFRIVLSVYALISFFCMLAPALLIDERKYSRAKPVSDSFPVSFGAVFHDACFRPYLVADICYRIASAFAISGFSYYVTVLLELPRSFTTFFLLFIFFANLALYIPVCALANRVGKRRMLLAAFFMLIVFFIEAAFAGKYPLPSVVQGVILSTLIALPVAVFTVIPNAIVADLSVASEKKTGVQRAGMYFGVQTLVMKFGQMFSALLFPLVMAIGSGKLNGTGRTGLRLTLVLAAFFALVGFCALFGYREREVTVLLEKKD